MSKRDYEKLTIEVFGRHLISSGDLDPVYVALPKAIPDPRQRARWLLAYWCFYHCGVASYMSEFEGKSFWQKMQMAAVNEEVAPDGGRWPRAKERRHARGEAGIKMVNDLQERHPFPEQMVQELQHAASEGIDFKDFAPCVTVHTLFGPWIAFKIGDMLERIEGCQINFEGADIFMFKDPTKAALMLFRERAGISVEAKLLDEAAAIKVVVGHLSDEFHDMLAPPNNNRGIKLQEIETVLCKWKSHVNGHYPLNNDLIEISDGLDGWGETANNFKFAMPKVSV